MDKNALDYGKITGVDFKKAFNLVCQQLLASKLQACHISGNLRKLLESYLHKQFVEINGKSSDLCKVKYGVSHRSLLGPKLFGLQVTDLREVPNEGVLARGGHSLIKMMGWSDTKAFT